MQADDQRDDHDRPDDGFGQDDAEVAERRDQQHDRTDFAEGLAQAGNDGSHMITDALQGVAVHNNDHRDEIEQSIHAQISRSGINDLLRSTAGKP